MADQLAALYRPLAAPARERATGIVRLPRFGGTAVGFAEAGAITAPGAAS